MASISSSAPPLHLSSLSVVTFTANRRHTLPVLSSVRNRKNLIGVVCCSNGGISEYGQGAFDPDLRSVLELATEPELYELERILFGPSYFSPLLKSVTKRRVDIDYAVIEEDLEEREAFIAALESRFLFLAADARSTLRGWRPSYRNVLLAVRKKLNISCSRKLSTEDLEAEIFLHLVQDYSSEEIGTFPGTWELPEFSNDQGSLEHGLRQWKGASLDALKLGLGELQSMFLKGGAVLTMSRFYQLFTRKLSGKVFLEAANYQIKKEVMKKGGQLAAINLESRVALLAAKQNIFGWLGKDADSMKI
ncbi:hypothetical protein JCGZ_15532 [Jatropha curcas]|uniref:Uncharacterized protein n=1 Tax=Jatropha curcas TaxID=180498 RepID=A0A067K3F9_JATCU|nr:hypothetical protein JCGZ_15532 [Jatropha curcas]